MGLFEVVVVGFIGLVVLNSLNKTNIPPQEVTSPQREVLGGLRSTNKLGLDLQTGLANLRDNFTFGGILFQG